MNGKVTNRWFVVIGAIMIQLALGAIYAWSVFTKLLTDPDGVYGFTASQTAWVFSAGLATFAIVMVIAGKLIPKLGPRKVTILGGLLLGTGYILGGFFGNSFLSQLICVGFIGGSGIGMAYVVPIAVGVKWFPDKKGLITGLSVAGFGFGATIWVKLAGSWFGGLMNITHVFGLPGVQSVFIIYGIAFAILVLLGSIVMVNPPEGYAPKGWTPPTQIGGNPAGTIEYDYREMLKSPQFYRLWIVFIFSALAGLMVIYAIRLFGMDALQYHNINDAGRIAGTAMAWYAIFNGLGRIFWGSISDRIGRRNSIVTMTLLQSFIMLAIYHGFITFATSFGLILGASIIGFNFGGNFALFPAVTADFFGNKNVGSNYGWMFTAYGVAGILGPQIAGFYKDSAIGSNDPTVWMTPFIIAGIACLMGAIIMMTAKAPQLKKVEAKIRKDNA
ncbi:MAG: OFA family MFS transporter [Candidatus Marinimicrobia bacterium]|jgi:MFS family permease|nr:OFA family MFS transporter [Candidatus Neomarinimicrobiota bacterium]MBT3683709.1 OFA family MFS transporter [Candidatus Neomarinimicrobiota bacterium]MBT3760708.1 OFA family MFS transporter [Candidatus Neomarinimicrobiota bacterium]MBT3896734.1 OFA family MFS transporter [Candidatus Neomarinimicrobiota bacterium]MBT4173792.1 OFA family MFS transporter [Candidatus Neomarinimicrobiota bacterium]